jgi:hypothetical protein
MGRELKNNSYGHKVLLDIFVVGNILFGFLFCFCIFLKHFNYQIVFFTKDSAAVFDCVQENMDYRAMKRSYQFLVLLIIYLLTLGIRVYWLTQKNGLHIDEGWEVPTVYCNDYPHFKYYELNKEYTGKEINEITFCDDGTIKSALGDIYRLWKDNGGDNVHPNLYYLLLRLSLVGLRTWSIKLFIFRGGILNLISFTISFVFFFLLMNLFFTNSRLLQFSATACAFLSTATISNTLLLREYQIQETMLIVFCYYFFKTISLKKYCIHEKSIYINTKLILFLSLVTAFTFLTGYYTIIFVGFFGLYVVFINFKTKNYVEIVFYIVILCLGFLFAHIFYPGYFSGFFSSRALETKQTLFTDYNRNITSSIASASAILIRYYFTFPVIGVLVLCLIILICQKHKLIIQTPALCVFMVSILFVVIVQFLAPIKTLRYVMPVFPFFVFIPSLMIYSIQDRKLSMVVVLLLCIAFSKDALNQDKIEHLYRNKSTSLYFHCDIAVPVYVVMKTGSRWKCNEILPYFSDEQVYYFFDNYEDIFLPGYDEFYLIVEKGLEQSDANLAKKYETKQVFTLEFLSIKKLLLKENNKTDNL